MQRGRSFFYIRQGVGVGEAQEGTGRQGHIGREDRLALFVCQAALDEAVDGIFFVDRVAQATGDSGEFPVLFAIEAAQDGHGQ